ncbi:MAG TPA: efflux RND transporter periplasmic adaptor subunit [Caulobacteraceae bacterium]|jgi:membrane fusion protein (multidrug efflux system)|nr:efflux RND transporter periplasmic adaptor subunit [Caulobacteraceae bacterium]
MNFSPLARATAATLVLAAGCARHESQGGQGGDRNQGTPDVGVITLTAAPVVLTAELAGRTSPFETSDVRPQVGGVIIGRPFTEGANVRAGQILYQIDPAPYRAAYDQARAQQASAQANVVTTQLKAQRYGELVKINGVSKQDADDAEAAYKQAAASVQQLKAAATAARINLAYATITAPISGRAGRSTVTKGALVTAAQTAALTTIQRLDPIYVDVTQSAADLLRLKRAVASGQLTGGPTSVPVRLKLEDGSLYPQSGKLQFTDVTVDQTTGAVTLRAIFPNPDGVLLPGMYVRAEVAEGVAPSAVLAPQQGVSRDERGLPTALVVDGAGKAQLRSLTLGQAVAGRWLVTSGLKPGDRLIVDGLQRAKAGQAVHAAPANLPAPSPTES